MAWLSSAASGTMARTDSTKSSVGASAASVSATKTAGTKTSSHSSGLWRISFSNRVSIAGHSAGETTNEW